MSGPVQGFFVRTTEAAGSALTVGMVIAEDVRSNGMSLESRPLTLATIMRRTKRSRSTVQRAITELEELGDIVVQRNRGQGNPNLYAFPRFREAENILPIDPFAVSPMTPQKDVAVSPTTPQCGVTHDTPKSTCGVTGDRFAVSPVTPPSLSTVKATVLPTTSGGSATPDDYPLRSLGDEQDEEDSMSADPPLDPPLTQTPLPGQEEPSFPDPPEESRNLTPQQRAIGRVQAAFEQAGVEAPHGGQVAGLLRNLGGLQEVDTLMQLIRGLVRRGELSVGALFAAIKGRQIGQDRGGGTTGKGKGPSGGRGGGPRRAGLDDSRLSAIDRIARQAKEAAGGS